MMHGAAGREAGLTPEFGLAVDCCRWGFRGRKNEREARLREIDWRRFVRIARFHRIEGLAAAYLGATERGVPPNVREQLAGFAAEIAGRNLQASADCRAILKAFEAAGVPLLFLKGLALGRLVYANPLLKSAIDIDLLIAPADLPQAAKLLRDCGYGLAAPRDSAGDAALIRWHRGWKESVWMKAEPPLQIDLHTRVTDNLRLIRSIGVESSKQWVQIGNGIRLPTLADGELFAYLAVHGAWSAWFRLKWISDFAGLLHGRAGEEIERLFRRSQGLGAGRAAGQALLLADALFETLRGAPELKAALLNDAPVRRLCRAALRLLTREPREPTDSRLGSLPIRWTQLFLLPGIGFKLSELSGQAYRVLNRPPAKSGGALAHEKGRVASEPRP
jgi:hypothetical protein